MENSQRISLFVDLGLLATTVPRPPPYFKAISSIFTAFVAGSVTE